MNQMCNLGKINEQRESQVYSAKPKCCSAKSPEWETLTKIGLVAAATVPPHSNNSAQELCYTPGESTRGGGQGGEIPFKEAFHDSQVVHAQSIPLDKGSTSYIHGSVPFPVLSFCTSC